MNMFATFWALVPPIVAIVLALITKEVYSSLFVGIVVGGLFFSGFSFEGTLTHIFNDGFVSVLSDPYNVGIIIFLVILGAMVSLMNRAGGSAAFGRFAKQKIKTRAGAQLATIALGVLIFIDDYFNCLTVGSVMRPVTDQHRVSRAKLAYLIDATGLHYRPDFLLGSRRVRLCGGGGRIFHLHQCDSLQLLRSAHHSHDDRPGGSPCGFRSHEAL